MSKGNKRYGSAEPPEARTEQESRQFKWRSIVLLAVFALVLGAYGFVLYDTQIRNGDAYRTTASYTIKEKETVDTVRGDLLDSRGNVLVSNSFHYEVTLDTSLMGKDKNDTIAKLLVLCREMELGWTDNLPITDEPPYEFTREDVYTYLFTRTAEGEDGEETTTTEERLTNLGALAVKYKWIDNPLAENPKDNGVFYLDAQALMAKMCKSFGIKLAEGESVSAETRQLLGVLYELALRSRDVVYTQYTFTSDVDITFISRVKEAGLAGVKVESVATRQYFTDYAAHVLGTTGTYLNDAMWQKYKELGYSYDAIVGRSGVELAFEQYLHGTSGVREIERSDQGKITDQEWLEEPVPGGNVTLTLDIGLQEVVENALAAHAQSLEEAGGAACAVVDMTGGVLALASYPTYHLATYSQDFNDLLQDPLQPMLNRATNGLYAPGSTFKLLTATAGLMEGIITPNDTIRCTGQYRYEGWRGHAPWCWKRSGHGTENLMKAIKDSCNVYFFDVGRRVGIARLDKYAALFGLGQNTGIEIGDAKGRVAGPETSESLGQTWYEGNITSAAIGQENNQCTPLQLANYIATLVNGGDHYAAHLLQSVSTHDNSAVTYEYEPELLGSIDISASALKAMKEGMYQVTQNAAIAKYFSALPVKAGAKTGTAELRAGVDNKETNGLLVVFAPYEDPQIAMCIVMEKGASGGSLASIAADILNYYFGSSGTVEVPAES